VTRVQVSLLVEAGPEAVWDVLTDPNYIPKLYPDLLNASVDPPGRAAVGQNRKFEARAGKRLIEIKTRVSEMVPLKKFAVTGRRGSALDTFLETVELEKVKGGTLVRILFEFKVSEAYFGPGFDLFALNQAAKLNEELFAKNLKELSELQDPKGR